MLTKRGTTEFDARFDRFYSVVNNSYNISYMLTTPLTIDAPLPCFGVTDVVEMDAVDIVVSRNLFAYICQIISGICLFWMKISFISYFDNKLGVFLSKSFAS